MSNLNMKIQLKCTQCANPIIIFILRECFGVDVMGVKSLLTKTK